MPFRSDDQFSRRTQVLEFLRLKHIIEEISLPRWLRGANGAGSQAPPHAHQSAPEAEQRIEYQARVLHQRVGYFPERALKEIAEADVLIGVVSHDSTNVIFELATRHLLRDGLILLLDGSPHLLPIYFEGMIRIDYGQFRSPVVDQVVRLLAAEGSPLDFRDSPPRALTKEIDTHEVELKGELKNALRDFEEAEALRPEYIRHLARYVSPSSIVESWQTYHPFCVIEAWWKRMSGDGYYEEDDCVGGPWVSAGNQAFRDLYCLESVPDPAVTPRALSGLALIRRLTDMRVLDNPDAFLHDQARIGRAIFYHQQNLPAVVPLIINDRHDDPRFRRKKLLPAIVGRTTVGPLDRRHKSHLTVLYVPVDERP